MAQESVTASNTVKPKKLCLWHIVRGGAACENPPLQQIDYCRMHFKELELSLRQHAKGIDHLTTHYERRHRDKTEPFSERFIIAIVSGVSGSVATALIEHWDTFVRMLHFGGMFPPGIFVKPAGEQLFLGRLSYQDDIFIDMGCNKIRTEDLDDFVISVLQGSDLGRTEPRHGGVT